MASLRNFSPREYQANILKACKNKNCLVILPTGVGKTGIALLLALERLNEFAHSKILFCSPTKPLCQQHTETFTNNTDLNKEDILLYTGMLNPKNRAELFQNSKVIIATPQTIQSDIENSRINLSDFSLLILDEAHKSKMKYANTFVAKNYIENAKNPRILALTASPGSTKEKINEICSNLFIEDVEIRTEDDSDVKPYLQKKTVEYIGIDLGNEFDSIRNLLKEAYKEKIADLKKLGITKPTYLINKRDLIILQKQLQKEIAMRNPSTFFGLSLVAKLLKLKYLIELIETQSLKPFHNFMHKLKTDNTKAAKSLLNIKEVIEAEKIADSLVEKGMKHPKIEKLNEIIKGQFSANPKSKIIIFANYRDTIEEIMENLKHIKNCLPVKLIGHREGITQKQQLETIGKFDSNEYNCLLTTSIGEEGLSMGTLDIAIFYDNVPSAIRRIQREGRVARIKPGKIIYLTVKNSIDSAYHWKSRRDEKTMKSTISNIKNKLGEQQELARYTKNESDS